MSALKCLKWIREDKLAAICFNCEGASFARSKAADLERDGYSVTMGYCQACITRFALDSFRRTQWEIPNP